MALAPLVLDDLRFEEMVASVRRRIPGASDGRWTHHAPTDPGITLLELFAWLIEQRIYWLDQVSEETGRALLAVLGEAPRPTRPAATVLALRDRAERAFLEVAGGSELTLRAEPPRTFTAPRGTVLAPVARIGLATPAGDRSAELAAGRAVRLLPADGGPAELELRLWLSDPLPAPRPAGELSLLFDLEAPPGIAPEWSPDAAEGVPPPAALEWLYRPGPGAARRFPAGAVADGTAGLRRSGLVRLPLADDWEPSGPAAADGALPYSVVLRTEAATFTAPPVLRRLVPGAVAAEHWKAVTVDPAALAEQARRWLKLPGQTLELPPEEAPPLEATVELRLPAASGDPDAIDWQPVADFAFSGPEERVFQVDREARLLRFGDGLTGRVPVPADPAAPQVEVRYRAGGGAAGELGSGQALGWEAAFDGDVVASNPVAAAGGAEAETVERAVERVAGELRRRHRAVVRGDYEELARTTPGVAIARALAAIGHHPDHPCARVPGAVTVFLVPWATRPDAGWERRDPSFVAAPETDPGALQVVAARLDRARLVGTEVFVRTARYRAVSLDVALAADPADGAGVTRRVEERLGRFLDPLAGGEGGSGWSFGEPVRPSALVRQVQRVVARDGVVQRVAIGLDGAAPKEDCEDVEIAPYDLVYLDAIRVRFDRAAAAAGGLP